MQATFCRHSTLRYGGFLGADGFRRSILFPLALIATLMAVSAQALYAQTVTIKGLCTDAKGKPLVSAVVEYVGLDNNNKYTLKTNHSGEYFSFGISPGKYKVVLYKSDQDRQSGKILYQISEFEVELDVNRLDVNPGAETSRNLVGNFDPQPVRNQNPGYQGQVQSSQFSSDFEKIKYLNNQLSLAQKAMASGNIDQSISILNSAVEVDAAQDLLWFKLGETYRLSGDSIKAITAYQKAIQIKPTQGAYHNNLGEAYWKLKRVDDALSEYALAAQVDSTDAANYIFNMGAVLTNSGKWWEAISAFTLTIKLDPTRADAYYQKGVNLLGQSMMQSNGMISPHGTKAAFQMYLNLSPSGQHAKDAAQLISSITGESTAPVPYEHALTQAFDAAQPFNSSEDYKAGMQAEVAELKRQNSSPIWAQKASDFWNDPTIASALQRQLAIERLAKEQAQANAQYRANAQAATSSEPTDDFVDHSKTASFLSALGLMLNTANTTFQQVEANKMAQQQARFAAQQSAAQAAAQRQPIPPPTSTYPKPPTQTQPQSSSSSSSSGGTRSSGPSSGGSSGSALPTPKPSDLGITQNWVDPACNGTTNAHYEIANNSYYSASVTVQLSYQVGGVQSAWTVTQNVGPRAANDYIQQIPCGDQSQPGDYGNSNIAQWQFQ
jgi:tetratricopeptide (TPR) repeat protein